MESKTAKHLTDQVTGDIGNHYKYITIFSPKTLHQAVLFGPGEKLDDIGFQAPVDDFHPCHTFGPEGGRDLHGVFILEHIFTQCRCLSLYAEPFNLSPVADDLSENGIPGILNNVRDILKCHVKANVRPISAVMLYGLTIFHPGKRSGQVLASQGKHPDRQLFDDFINEFFINKRRLQIQLGKLRLPVRSQVFITETPGYLEIAVSTAHHKELLKELGGLWQGIEFTLMYPAWHEIIPGSLRGALGKKRGFYLNKIQLVKVLPDTFDDLISFNKNFLHRGAAKVKISVL